LSHKILVEDDPHQTRVAVLEEDLLTEVFVERRRHRGLVGNVYKGRVTRVLPGMQAAFVDVGLERDAFLYVSDVHARLEHGLDGELNGELNSEIRGEMSGASDGEGSPDVSPDDAVGEELPEPDPDAEAGFASDPGTSGGGTSGGANDGSGAAASSGSAVLDSRSIDDLLKQGQEIIVQVVKDPLPNKGARITTHVTLPGRYLVLLPTVRHFGISRRIQDPQERERLLDLMERIAPAQTGLIVRTVGEGRDQEDFEADLAYLTGLWRRLLYRGERASAPTVLHRDFDVALRTVRDLLGPDISIVWVDGEETYERIVDFLDDVQPGLVRKVKLFEHQAGLFERFGIEEQIEAALKSKVWLKSGGYIVIHPTEALVAIDVNTGRYVGERDLEHTVLQTNLEAVQEIVRQIRLRDLGGILVIDLIDMVEAEHRQQVFEALEAELKKDRARTKMLSISEFGLVEITRKRSRANLERLLTQPCPYCEGRGRIKSLSTICLNLRRELLRTRRPLADGEVLLRVHPEVAQALQQEERAILDEVERSLSAHILLQSDPALHHERFDIVEM
jgi:ribonuclease G